MAFTIVFIPAISATKLRIPTHISVEESVTLRDQYKNTWQVQARRIDGHWYLLDGWSKFVVDSSVTITDTLLFKCCGPALLDVTIQGMDGELKAGVGYRKTDIPQEHQIMESDDDYTFERVPSGKSCYASGSRKPQQKKRNIDDWRGNMNITSRSAPRPKIPFSAAKMPPHRMNEVGNKGKRILNESSDKDPDSDDSDDWAIDSYVEISEEEFNSRNADKLKSKLPPRRKNEMDNKVKGIRIESSGKDSGSDDSDYSTSDSSDEISGGFQTQDQ